MPNLAHPIQAHKRVQLVDELRGLAVLGMLLVNIPVFGLPYLAFADPSFLEVFEEIDRALFNLTSVVLEGSMRAIFCVLFGVGVLLQIERATEAEPFSCVSKLHRRRMGWLLLFGMIDAYLLQWFGDILFLYGLVGLLLPVFRNMTPARLLLIACLIISLLAAQNLLFGELNSAPENFTIQTGLTGEDAQQTPASAAKLEVEARSAGYASAWPMSALYALVAQISYLGRGFWDALALMLIGMAIYKSYSCGFTVSAKRCALISLVGFVIALPVNCWELWTSEKSGMPALVLSLWTYDLGRIALATGYVGLFMLMNKRNFLRRTRELLATTGRMALTNYMMQSAICLVIFVQLGFFGKLRIHELCLAAVAIWVFQVSFSAIWLSCFRFGPLEWLLRSLSYKKRQPMLIRT